MEEKKSSGAMPLQPEFWELPPGFKRENMGRKSAFHYQMARFWSSSRKFWNFYIHHLFTFYHVGFLFVCIYYFLLNKIYIEPSKVLLESIV